MSVFKDNGRFFRYGPVGLSPSPRLLTLEGGREIVPSKGVGFSISSELTVNASSKAKF